MTASNSLNTIEHPSCSLRSRIRKEEVCKWQTSFLLLFYQIKLTEQIAQPRTLLFAQIRDFLLSHFHTIGWWNHRHCATTYIIRKIQIFKDRFRFSINYTTKFSFRLNFRSIFQETFSREVCFLTSLLIILVFSQIVYYLSELFSDNVFPHIIFYHSDSLCVITVYRTMLQR